MTPPQKLPPIPYSNATRSAPLPLEHRPFSDPNRLAPEDAFFTHSPPTRHREHLANGHIDNTSVTGEIVVGRTAHSSRRRHEKGHGRSGSRKGKGRWSKLLWVKHDCTN